MKPACPQCKQPIKGSESASYVVGWCQRDVHDGCLLLHIRRCKACRTHNGEFVEPVGAKA